MHESEPGESPLGPTLMEMLPVPSLVIGVGLMTYGNYTDTYFLAALGYPLVLAFFVGGLGWIFTGRVGRGCLIGFVRGVIVMVMVLWALTVALEDSDDDWSGTTELVATALVGSALSIVSAVALWRAHSSPVSGRPH